MILVGSDVHVRNGYFYATDLECRRRGHGRVANEAAELRSFCERLREEAAGEVQPIRFVLESTTHSREVQRQSVAAFCRQARVSQLSVVCRRRKLEPASGFTEVKLAAEPEPVGVIEVFLPGGRSLRVRPGLDRRTLLELNDVAGIDYSFRCNASARPRAARDAQSDPTLCDELFDRGLRR